MPENKQLTREIIPPAGPGKVFAVVVLPLVFIVICNSLARRALYDRTSNLGYWLVTQKWRLLDDMDEAPEWLVIGDSSCNQAVRTDTFERRFGSAPINLCTMANMLAVEDAWMLQLLVERGIVPDNVIMIHVYDVWTRRGTRGKTFAAVAARTTLDWGFWNELEPNVEMNEEQRRIFALSRYVPLYSQNKTLSEWVLEPSSIGEIKFSIDDHGYMPMPEANPKNVRRDARGHRRFVRRRFRLSRPNRDALIRIRTIVEEHDIQLYMANAPVYEGLARHRRWRRYIRRMNAKLKRFAKSSPNIHYIFRDPPRFPADQLQNVDHLTHEGAARYTELLADAIEHVQR